MAFRWRADDGPTLNAGSVGSFAIISGDLDQNCLEILYLCVCSEGGGRPDPLPPLWIRT